MEAKPTYRYRLTFGKGREIKYLAHLDVVLAWTRIFRRADIPLAYTGGFNPQARIQVASGLPLGTMGSAELMDIYLIESMPPAEILNRVRQTLPPGFTVLAAEEIELKAPVLQSELQQAEYVVAVETDLSVAQLQTQTAALLAQTEILQTRIRRKKQETFDLRPLLHDLAVGGSNDAAAEVLLTMRLSTGQHGNLRPEAVLKALELDQAWYQINRTKLIFNI